MRTSAPPPPSLGRRAVAAGVSRLLFAIALAAAGCTDAGHAGSSPDSGAEPSSLEAPAAAEGFQLHYGPTDLDDPDEVRAYTLDPSAESNDCITLTTPNESDVFYDRYLVKMRHGAHHQAITCTLDTAPDGTLAACFDAGLFGAPCWLLEARGSIGPGDAEERFPPQGESAPENEGLAFALGKKTRVHYNMHFINTGETSIVRESWTNFYYSATPAPDRIAHQIVFAGGIAMDVAPHTEVTIPVSCPVHAAATQPLRVITLVSHTHAHSTGVRVYHVPAGEAPRAIYGSYDWAEPLQAFFDSTTKNTPPDFAARRSGAMSGPLYVAPGDTLAYECDISNTSETSLHFANEVFTAEMCNLFGAYAPSQGSYWTCLGE